MRELTDAELSDLLIQIGQELNPGERIAFAFKNPVVFDSARLKRVTVSGSSAAAVAGVCEVEALSKALRCDARRYRMDETPFETIFRRLEDGEVAQTVVLAQVGTRAFSSRLSPLYVLAASAQCVEAARAGVDAQRMLVRHRIICESAKSLWRADHPDAYALVLARSNFLWVAAEVLLEQPSARLLAEAKKMGHAALADAQALGIRPLVGKVYYAMGAVVFDVYCHLRDLTQYRHQATLRAHVVGDDALPTEAVSLPEARHWLRRSVELREGEDRGYSAKTLAFLCQAMSNLGLEVSETEIDECADLALTLIPEDAAATREALRLLRSRRGAMTPSLLGEFDARQSSDSLEIRLGAYLNVDPDAGMALLAEVRRTMHSKGDREKRWFLTMVLSMIWAHARLDADDQVALESCRSFDAILHVAKARDWNEAKVLAASIFKAEMSSSTNDELSGLSILQDLFTSHPALARLHADALLKLRAALLHGVGVNCYRKGNFDEACFYYVGSLRLSALLGLRDECLAALVYIKDVLGPQCRLESVAGLRAPELLLRLDELLADDGLGLLQQIGRQAVYTARHGTYEEHAQWIRAFKGLRFARALSSGPPKHNDSALLRMIERARELEIECARKGMPEPTQDIDGVIGRSLRDRDEVATTGSSPLERLRNVQIAAERRFNECLHRGSVGVPFELPQTEAIRNRLDPWTVLIELFVGSSESDRESVFAIFLTRDLVAVRHADWVGAGTVANRVRQVRAEIRRQAHPRPFTAGRRNLKHGLDTVLGRGAEKLLELLKKNGKRHLCIVPHGSLHYFPFHLLESSGRTLASDWSMSYLPHVRLVDSVRPGRHAGDIEFLGIALGFDGKDGGKGTHVAVPEIRDSAQKIGALFGIEVLVDEAATKAEFMQRAPNARFIHLATHAQVIAAAPSFQRFVLAPDTVDGWLHAHEIGSLDLSGVQLITLGACETAIGRFDEGDNLRGLIANLFIAGVGSVVSTLWEVEVGAAATFFDALYSALVSGQNTLDAFQCAQALTRKAHPQPRDWGAFQLAGVSLCSEAG